MEQSKKDCSLTLPSGKPYEFRYEDIGAAIKFAFEKKIPYIITPFGVLSLIEKDVYDNVMFFASDGTE